MADLNEPKKETVRITLPPRTPHRPTIPVDKEAARINLPNRQPSAPAPTAKPPAAPSQPAKPAPVRPPQLVAPKPIPPAGVTTAAKPAAPPMSRPPAPIPSVARPPASPAPSPVAGAVRPSSSPPPKLPTLKAPVLPSAAAIARSPFAPAVSKPVVMPMKPESANHAAPASPRKETARIAPMPESPMKATVKLTSAPLANEPPITVIRTMPPAVVKPDASSLGETIPVQFCWALLAISGLALLIQLWIYYIS